MAARHAQLLPAVRSRVPGAAATSAARHERWVERQDKTTSSHRRPGCRTHGAVQAGMTAGELEEATAMQQALDDALRQPNGGGSGGVGPSYATLARLGLAAPTGPVVGSADSGGAAAPTALATSPDARAWGPRPGAATPAPVPKGAWGAGRPSPAPAAAVDAGEGAGADAQAASRRNKKGQKVRLAACAGVDVVIMCGLCTAHIWHNSEVLFGLPSGLHCTGSKSSTSAWIAVSALNCCCPACSYAICVCEVCPALLTLVLTVASCWLSLATQHSTVAGGLIHGPISAVRHACRWCC